MTSPRPRLVRCGPAAGPLAAVYDAALHNVLDVNAVERADTPGGPVLRAGGGYAEPWTRDASINSWYAASWLAPDLAARTLWKVCDLDAGLVAQDDQWWDQIIWVVAARHHAVVTGDRDFQARAYPVAAATAAKLTRERLDHRFGLYQGPAVMQDGISGYPTPPNDPAISSSFVLDYPEAARIMCLSTNALYAGAFRALAAMAGDVGADPGPHLAAADAVAAAVNRHLWRDDAGTYGAFLHGAGELEGRRDDHQEALGLALAVLFGVAGPEQRRSVITTAVRRAFGITNVEPHFPRYDDDHPGRHNAICWPMVMGVWADAVAHAGDGAGFGQALSDLVRLLSSSGGLWELYNAVTGAVDGGWQQGRQWDSQPDQTWSATTLLGLVHHRLAGLRPTPGGLAVAPVVPPGWGPIELAGLPDRRATLDVTVEGSGQTVAQVALDGQPIDGPVAIPTDLAGRHRLDIRLG
ncbi:MAG TPA: hypothetical protein VKV06_02280 [Acidimicrobiales bacterium]|nr:hypothetical protein [Acidimicrobiales bacterium]